MLARFVGISENVGHAMSYRVLLKSGVIVVHAVARTAMKPGRFNNRRARAEAAKTSTDSEDESSDTEPTTKETSGEIPVVETVTDSDDDESPYKEPPTADTVEHSNDDDSEVKEFTKSIQHDVLRSVHEDDTLW